MGPYCLKRIAVITLFFFLFLTLFQSYAPGQTAKTLEKKLEEYLMEEDYQGAIKMLKEHIKTIRNARGKNKEVARAYYYLARAYFQDGLTNLINPNLRNAYETYPYLEMEEPDREFKQLVWQVRQELSRENFESVKKDNSNYIEKQREKKKKEKKFPWLLIATGIVIIGVVIILTSVSKEPSENYDITGTWDMEMSPYNQAQSYFTLVFSGSKSSGTVTSLEQGGSGTYQVFGSTFEFYLPSISPYKFTGIFKSHTSISGDLDSGSNYYPYVAGHWSAVKQ